MIPQRVQGLDVGASGGATCLHPNGSLAEVWAWKPCTRAKQAVYLVARARRGPDGWTGTVWIEPSIPHIGAQLATWCEPPCQIVVEGAYVGRLNPGTGITQAVNIGRLVAAGELRLQPGSQARIVVQSEWKTQILPPQWRERMRTKYGKLTASEADKLASLSFVPARVPGLSDGLELLVKLLKVKLEALHHVTDSAGVAAFLHLRVEG